jgi:glyoxylase-like metal-dependent hydrolase (beta-lactamase superfamily II)
METSKVSVNIGPYLMKAVPTGVFGLDGGAMFGTVPKVLWEKSNPTDAHNRIEMEARALLLKSKDRNILIDTGNGQDFVEKYGPKVGAKFAEIYAVDRSSGLVAALQKNGISPGEVTDVILTHLHFDHAGGSTKSENGKIVPTFPKAKYYVQKKNLETAKNPNIREKASYLRPNFEPLLEANCLELLDGPVENLFPGVSLLISNGHTQAQQIVKISDSQKGLFYAADVIPTSSHVRSAWVMGYDLFPLLIIEEKRRIMKEAAEKGYYIYFEHDPYCDFASITQENDDFKVTNRYSLQ